MPQAFETLPASTQHYLPTGPLRDCKLKCHLVTSCVWGSLVNYVCSGHNMHNKRLVSQADTIWHLGSSKLPVVVEGVGAGLLKCGLLARVGAEAKETRQLS